MNLRPLTEDTTGSFIPVILYIIGITVFGFLTWLLDGILVIFRENPVLSASWTTEAYDVNDILWFIWYGIIIIYLIVGGIWLIRTYNEQQYQGGFYG